MKRILVSLALLFAGFGLVNMPISAAEEVPAEEPIVEVVDEEPIVLTQEELDQRIAELVKELMGDGYELVIGFWEAFTAIVGMTGIGAIIALALWIMRRFGLFNKRMETNDEVIVQGAQATERMAEELIALKKMMLAFIAIANVDPAVKTQLIENLSANKTVEDFIKIANNTIQNTQVKVNEETSSLLEQLSKRV